jgi:hypothetical protein
MFEWAEHQDNNNQFLTEVSFAVPRCVKSPSRLDIGASIKTKKEEGWAACPCI